MRRTWDHPAYPRPRDSPVTSSLRLSTSGWLTPRECLACLLDRFWFSPRHSPFTPALGSRSATRSSREECTSVVHFSNFPTRSTGRLLRGGMAPVSLHFRPFSPPCENWNENFYHRGTCHSRRMRFPRADIISTRNRVVGSNRCARSFLSFFLFHEWNERGRLHLRILRVLRFIISRRCVCVCACACVVYTRTRYTSVCARGINLRAFHDNCAGSYCCRLAVEAVSSVVAPTLLLFGWCSSFCSQRRARTTFRHGTLFGFRGRFLPKE